MGKRWKGYFVFLIIAVLLFLGVGTGERYFRILLDNMKLSPYTVTALRFVIYLIAGMVFGLEKFFTEIKSEGHWKVNIPRLLIMGTPSLIMGLLTFSFSYLSLLYPSPYVFACFMQMLLGYAIVTSLYKSK